MAFSSEVLTLDRRDGIATCWLDRPDQLNAFGPAFWNDLPAAMEVCAHDETVRAMVIAGRGRAFSSGIDVKALAGLLVEREDEAVVQQRRRLYREIKHMQAALTAVAACPKPVLAAVHGYCLGAGVDLVTACDIRLAAADALFSVRETKMAIVADLGTLQRLTPIVGPGHAAELVYTGADIDAERARRIGLVNDVYADVERLHEAAHTMAHRIARNSPLAVQGAKAVLQAGEGRTVDEALDYVALWNAAFLPSNDLEEALVAFQDKRPPVFTGE